MSSCHVILIMMNWAQLLYKYTRPKNISKIIMAVPLFNLLYVSKINRYHVIKSLIFILGIVPLIGLLRRPYLRHKFHKQLAAETETKEIELKESLSQLDVKLPDGQDYMVVVSYSRGPLDDDDGSPIHREDEEYCRKIYTLWVEHKQWSHNKNEDIKWVFFGSESAYKLLREREGGFEMEFHRASRQRKEAKVYLMGRDEEGDEKVVT